MKLSPIYKSVSLFVMVLSISFLSLATVGAQSVTSSGAFTYSYPIEVPPGTNGMQPSLSLNYNSQAGNGILGMGFSLGGLSQITRDTDYPINWNADDHFLYNGQRLIPDSGGFYRTEAESFVRIMKNTTGDKINSWTVIDQSGMRYEYGATIDSFIDAVGQTNRARVWAVNKVQDVLGNYYEVSYEEDTTGGDFYPLKIVYTKTTSTPAPTQYRAVLFSYETRSDAIGKYKPSLVTIDKILTEIVIYTEADYLGNDGIIAKTIDIDHEFNTLSFRTRTTTISTKGISGNTLSSIDFKYLNQEDFFELEQWSRGDAGGGWLDTMQWHTGDFNGDGRTDLMKVWNENDRVAADVHISTGTGFIREQWSRGDAGGGWLDTMQWHTGDFNGDGRTDLMKVWNENDRVAADVHISTDTGFIREQWSRGDAGGGWLDSMQWHTGDFNGDGRTDLMKVWNENDRVAADVHISTGTGFIREQWSRGDAGGGWLDTMQWHTGDFNGDGRTDLMKVWNENDRVAADVHISTGIGFIREQWSRGDAGGGWLDSMQWHTGDFNGDGRTDLMKVWNENDRVAADVHASYISSDHSTLKDNKKRYSDFSDTIVEINSSHGSSIFIYHANLDTHSGSIGTHNYNGIDPSSNTYQNIANSQARNVVTSLTINDGFGTESVTNYYYHNGRLRNGPRTDSAGLGFQWIITEHADGTFTKTTYSQDYDGRTRGYPLVTESFDSNGNLMSKTQNIYGSLVELVPSDGDTHSSYWVPLEETRNFFYNGEGGVDGSTLSGDPIMSWTEYEYLTALVTEEDIRKFGQIRRVLNHGEVTGFGPTELDSQNDSVETVSYYLYDSNTNIVKPYKTETYAVPLNGSGTRTLASEQRYYYYEGDNRTIGDPESSGLGNKGLLARIEFENGATDVSQRLGYDVYGNIVQTQDAKGNDTTITYDSDYQTLPISVTNELDHTITTAYDDYLRPTITTDVNLGKWKQDYDEFGRVIAEYTPEDLSTPVRKYEPPRVSRRHNYVRGLCYGRTETVL